MQWITIAFSSWVKQPERLANLSLPSGLEVKNAWINISSSPTFLYGTCRYLPLSFAEQPCATTAVRMSYYIKDTVFIEPDSTQVRKRPQLLLQANYVRHFRSDKYHEIRACVSAAVKWNSIRGAAVLRQRCREQLVTKHWAVRRDYEHTKGRTRERKTNYSWGRKKQLFKDKNEEVKQEERKEREKCYTHADKEITKQEINKRTNNLEGASKRPYNKRDKEKRRKEGRKIGKCR